MPIKLIKYQITLFMAMSFFTNHSAIAQGCSDAGFCTMGAMRPNQGYSKKAKLVVKSVEMSQYYGLTSFYLTILAYNADINVGLSKRLSFQIKLPYQYVFGFLGNTQGLGDISLSSSYNIYGNEKMQLNGSIGAKIPTNDANKKGTTQKKSDSSSVEAPLPMYYQTSLGSYDAIAGLSLITRNWLFATGIQQALTRNNNEFLWGAWNKTIDSSTAAHYPKSKHLKRGTDVMLRAERNFRFTNWNIYAGLLGIYRITRDQFTEPNNTEALVNTHDYMLGNKSLRFFSDNLALSLLLGGGYKFSAKSGIKLMVGYRLVDRSSIQTFKKGNVEIHRNPDGLSRMLVTSVGYEYQF